MPTRRTVLVVDDDADCVAAIRLLLETDTNLHVLTARSGKEAQAILRGQQVDCVIADFRMPGLNGLDFLAQTKHDHPRIVRHLMTAYPDFTVAMRAINEVGVSGFFRKPIDVDTMFRVVEESMAAN